MKRRPLFGVALLAGVLFVPARHLMAPLLTLTTCFVAIALLRLPSASSASSPPAGSPHFHEPFDHEQYRHDHPLPAAKRLADLNVGEPRTVRMIYFLPRDRQALPDIDAKLDELIKDVQQSYAEQMENHGFGRRTFRFETDADGRAVVHHVKGKFDDKHYHTDTYGKVWKEMIERFDPARNIYLVTLDVSNAVIDGYCGQGADAGPEGGMTLIPAPNSALQLERGWSCFSVSVAAHELGHGFALWHVDSRNAIWSPSSYHTDRMLRSFCAAEWLDAHRYFNLDHSYPETDEKSTIRMLPPMAVPPNALRLRFEVTDPDGLHQTQLRTSAGYGAAVGCQAISGKRATVEFVTHQVLEDAALRVLDVNGNVTYQEFPIDITALLSPEIVSIPDANLAAVVKETLGLPPEDTITQLDMLRLRQLKAGFRQITDLTGLEHAVNLTHLWLRGNQIRDITPLAGLTLLVWLELISNSISDLSPLKQINGLEYLWLSDNSVSELSPLAGLTILKAITLAGNPISEKGPLYGLVRRNPFLEIDIDTRTLGMISGDGQEGAAGAALDEPFAVFVLDRYGDPLAGATVTFAVTGGGGSLSVTTAITDDDGRAFTTLTLGRDPETVTVAAAVAGLEPVTFTATARATPDFDGDGVTGFSDFFLFAEAFGSTDPRFDLDGSGTVDFGDFFLFAESFGQPPRAKLAAMARELIGLPDGPLLRQNAPNPFNSGTVISWFQLQPGSARLEVFALTGQRVAVLHEGPRKAGFHRLRWDARDEQGRPLASGVYVYRLVTAEAVQTRKLTLLR